MTQYSPAPSQKSRYNQANVKSGDKPLLRQQPEVFIRSGSQEVVSLSYIRALVKQCEEDYVANAGFIDESPCMISFIHDAGFLSLLSAQIETLANPALSRRSGAYALPGLISSDSFEGFYDVSALIVFYEKPDYVQGLAFYWALADKVQELIGHIGLKTKLKSLAVPVLNNGDWKKRLNLAGDCQAVAAIVLKEQDKSSKWRKQNER